jgi:hypothetical protein
MQSFIGCACREFRSQPDLLITVKQDLGKSALGGFLRKVPLVGDAVAENVVGEDPRYSYKMSQTQLETAWKQVQVHFRECPTCSRIVCLYDLDTQSGFCKDDSPRTEEISEARGAQAGAALKVSATAFGLGRRWTMWGRLWRLPVRLRPRWQNAPMMARWQRREQNSARSAAQRWYNHRQHCARIAVPIHTGPNSARTAAQKWCKPQHIAQTAGLKPRVPSSALNVGQN